MCWCVSSPENRSLAVAWGSMIRNSGFKVEGRGWDDNGEVVVGSKNGLVALVRVK